MTRSRVGPAIILSVLVGFVGIAIISGLRVPSPKAPVKPSDKPSLDIAIGASIVIEPPVVRYVTQLDDSERRDQIRDWAVIGTLVRSGAQVDDHSGHRDIHARSDSADAFEYGRGRRTYVGTRVLLFRDADDPDPVTTVGRLADRIRRELGELPPSVELYIVHDLQNEGEIRVERTADINRDALFSSAYGYVEGVATTPEQLGDWLARADDLTYAKFGADGRLLLGGRRFTNTSTANIDLEAVAALYQARFAQAANPSVATIDVSFAPRWLHDPGNPGRAWIASRLRALAADPCGDIKDIVASANLLAAREPDVARRSAASAAAIAVRDASRDASREASREASRDGTQLRGLANAPPVRWIRRSGEAWSVVQAPRIKVPLPPWCPARNSNWSAALTALAAKLEHSVGEASNSDFAAIDRLARGAPDHVLGRALRFRGAETRAGCPRSPALVGTGAGMTLRYTAILANAWSTDYNLSAPALHVPGFPLYERSRTWAEPVSFVPVSRATNGARVDSATGIHFDHQYVEILTENSSVEFQEVPAWWNQHFDEVAAYEQELHRLNQLFKWAQVLATLGDGTLATGLRDAKVVRGADFTAWRRRNRERLKFFDETPRLTVSTLDAQCFPFTASVEAEARPSGVRMAQRGGRRIETRLRIHRALAVEHSLHVEARPLVKAHDLVTPGEQFKRVIPERRERPDPMDGTTPEKRPTTIAKARARPQGLAIELRDGSRTIGTLEGRSIGDRVRLEWHVEPADRAKGEQEKTALDPVDQVRIVEIEIGSRQPVSPDDFARRGSVDAVHLRPEAVLRSLRALDGKSPSLESLELLRRAIAEIATPAAEKHIAARLAGTSLSSGALRAVRGRIVVTRDIVLADIATPRSSFKPTDLKNKVLYYDARLRLGREGLFTDAREGVARWHRRPHLKVEVMDVKVRANEALPDHFVDSAKQITFVRSDAPAPESYEGMHVMFVRPCVPSKAPTSHDACR